MDNHALSPLTLCLCKSTLAAGTTTTISTTSSTTSYLVYMIRGKTYTKADLSNTATPTTDYATGNAFLPVPANKGSIYMVGLDSSGNVKCIQGTVESLDSAGAFINAPQFGGTGPKGSDSTANDFCPIGYLVVKVGSTYVATTTGWLFGTHNNSSVTGVTYTFVSCGGWPSRPQIS